MINLTGFLNILSATSLFFHSGPYSRGRSIGSMVPLFGELFSRGGPVSHVVDTLACGVRMVSMKPPTVWINKYLSNTWEIIAQLRKDRHPSEFHILATHPSPHDLSRESADLFLTEPVGLSDDEYLSWCLQFAASHDVKVFIPGRKLLPLVAASDRFVASGTKILAAAGAAELNILSNKIATYSCLQRVISSIPEFLVARSLTEFVDAVRCLSARHRRVCFKPACSVYGIGFYILDEVGFASGPRHIRLDQALRRLERRPQFPPHLVMEYLPGPERSVDCLAHQGTLVRCVVRRKANHVQRIEQHPQIETIVDALTGKFRLNGVFNVQFRNARGIPYLLEVNPRMSGGLAMAHRAGVNLLLWAIRLAIGSAKPEQVPRPATDLIVPQLSPYMSSRR